MEEFNSSNEPLIHNLQKIIRFSVRVLAVLMTAVILWVVAEVC